MSTTPISRTAAIREARRHISIGAQGRGYVIYSPWRWDDPTGPNTASQEYTWSKARAECTRMQAQFALGLMGVDREDAWIGVARAQGDGIGNLGDIVAEVAGRLAARPA